MLEEMQKVSSVKLNKCILIHARKYYCVTSVCTHVSTYIRHSQLHMQYDSSRYHPETNFRKFSSQVRVNAIRYGQRRNMTESEIARKYFSKSKGESERCGLPRRGSHYWASAFLCK